MSHTAPLCPVPSAALDLPMYTFPTLGAVYAALPNNTHSIFRQALSVAGLNELLNDNTTRQTLFIPNDYVSGCRQQLHASCARNSCMQSAVLQQAHALLPY